MTKIETNPYSLRVYRSDHLRQKARIDPVRPFLPLPKDVFYRHRNTLLLRVFPDSLQALDFVRSFVPH
jgi:hypothetical protein